jgi:hypothetical protein
MHAICCLTFLGTLRTGSKYQWHLLWRQANAARQTSPACDRIERKCGCMCRVGMNNDGVNHVHTHLPSIITFSSSWMSCTWQELSKDPSWLRDKGQNVWWSHSGSQQSLYGGVVSIAHYPCICGQKVTFAPHACCLWASNLSFMCVLRNILHDNGNQLHPSRTEKYAERGISLCLMQLQVTAGLKPLKVNAAPNWSSCEFFFSSSPHAAYNSEST